MEKYIDLSKTLREQYPKLFKKIPRFVIGLLEIIIKQKKMNRIINKYIDYTGFNFATKVIEELNLTLEIVGAEKLPENGRCFFAANHAFGILDGMILASLIGNKYGKVMGISNDAFNLIPQLRPMVTVVNVYGKSAKKHIMELDQIYKSDLPINHFPAGEVSRKYNGKIEDKSWHKSFISKAISEKRDVVPVFFHGKNSWLFYAINSLRKNLKIKANIELILLPSEFFKKQNKKIKITVGQPISYQLFEGNIPHDLIAEKIRNHLYLLKNSPDEKFEI